MKKPICKNCQYFREHVWCSNSKSPNFHARVTVIDTCSQYYERDKKAPLGLRVANKILAKLKGK